MLTIEGMVICLALSALLGKHAKRMSIGGYTLIIIVALVQVGLVLYDIFTMQPPQQH